MSGLDEKEILRWINEARNEEYHKDLITKECKRISSLFPRGIREEKEKQCTAYLISKMTDKDYVKRFLEEKISSMSVGKPFCLRPEWSRDKEGHFDQEGYDDCMSHLNLEAVSDFWRSEVINFLKPHELPSLKVDKIYEKKGYIEFELLSLSYLLDRPPSLESIKSYRPELWKAIITYRAGKTFPLTSPIELREKLPNLDELLSTSNELKISLDRVEKLFKDISSSLLEEKTRDVDIDYALLMYEPITTKLKKLDEELGHEATKNEIFKHDPALFTEIIKTYRNIDFLRAFMKKMGSAEEQSVKDFLRFFSTYRTGTGEMTEHDWEEIFKIRREDLEKERRKYHLED